MDSSHETALDAKTFVQYLSNRSETIGGAGGVGDYMVLCWIKGCMVHAVAKSDVSAFGGSRDQDFFRASRKVGCCFITICEQPAALKDKIDAERFPRKLSRISLLENLNPFIIDNKRVFFGLETGL